MIDDTISGLWEKLMKEQDKYNDLKGKLDTIIDMLYDIREDTQLILDNPHPSIVDCGSAHRINNKIDEILKKLEKGKINENTI